MCKCECIFDILGQQQLLIRLTRNQVAKIAEGAHVGSVKLDLNDYDVVGDILWVSEPIFRVYYSTQCSPKYHIAFSRHNRTCTPSSMGVYLWCCEPNQLPGLDFRCQRWAIHYCSQRKSCCFCISRPRCFPERFPSLQEFKGTPSHRELLCVVPGVS